MNTELIAEGAPEDVHDVFLKKEDGSRKSIASFALKEHPDAWLSVEMEGCLAGLSVETMALCGVRKDTAQHFVTISLTAGEYELVYFSVGKVLLEEEPFIDGGETTLPWKDADFFLLKRLSR